MKPGDKVIIRVPESRLNGARGEIVAMSADGRLITVAISDVAVFTPRDLEVDNAKAH
jgi:hypothetical protein